MHMQEQRNLFNYSAFFTQVLAVINTWPTFFFHLHASTVDYLSKIISSLNILEYGPKKIDFENRPHYYFINTFIFIVKLHLLF